MAELSKEFFQTKDLDLEKFVFDFTRRKNFAFKAYNKIFKIWADNYKEWMNFRRAIDEDRYNKGLSNLMLSKLYEKQRAILPGMMLSMFSYSPLITYKSWEDEYNESATKIELFIDFQLFIQAAIVTFTKFMNELTVIGTSFLKIVRDKKFGVTIPRIIHRDPSEILVDPSFAYTGLPPRYYIDTMVRHIEDIKMSVKKKRYAPEILEEIETFRSRSQSVYLMSEYKQARLELMGFTSNIAQNPDWLNVDEYWVYGDYDGTGLNWWLTTIIGQRILARMVKPRLNRPPFIMANYNFDLHSDIGIGSVEPAVSYHREMQSARRQRMDNVNILNSLVFKLDRNTGFDKDDLEIFPGKVIEGDDINGLQPLDIRDHTQNTYADTKIIEEDINSAMNSYPYMAGQPPQRKEAGIGISMIQAAGAAPHKLSVELLNAGPITELGYLLLDFNKAYLGEGEIKFAAKKNLEYVNASVSKEDFLGAKFVIRPTASYDEGFGNRVIIQANLMKQIEILSSVNIQMLPVIKPILKEILRMSNIKDVEGIMNKLDEIHNEAKQQASLLQSAAAGAPPPATGQGGSAPPPNIPENPASIGKSIAAPLKGQIGALTGNIPGT